MIKIFVDTCVWRHWFTIDKIQEETIVNNAKSFQLIYDLVLKSNGRAGFIHNVKVEDELGEGFASEFRNKIIPYSTQVPVPLTLCDGAYNFGGSILAGGKMGGSLREMLRRSGYKHEEELQKAAKSLENGEFLYHKRQRKREFDIEHMESALEAEAHFFVTDDEKSILRPLREMVTNYDKEHPISMICSIAFTPYEAYEKLLEMLPKNG